MIRMLHLELHRAIFNIRFLIALVFGCVLAVLQFIDTVLPISSQLDSMINIDKGNGWIACSYEYWIEAYFFSPYSLAFFLLLPILAAFPYGASYFYDIKSGYIKSEIIRSSKTSYYFSKYIAISVSSFLIIVIPLLLNLFLAMTELPSNIPDIASGTSSITNCSILSSLYYSYPLIHALFFIILGGIFGSLFGLISFIISDFTENSIVVLLFPFILNIFLLALFDTINLSEASPVYFIRSGWEISSGYIVLPYIIIISGVAAGLCHFRKVKGDVF